MSHPLGFRWFFSAIVGSCLAASVSAGQTVVYVDRHATGPTADGTTWCTAYRDLQPTLVAAAAGTEIRVADGRYTPAASARNIAFTLKSGVTVLGGFAGCGADDPDARDFVLYETILSGDLLGNDGPNFTNRADNSYNVVRGGLTDTTALLEGFTISGGNADGPNPLDRGGGIRNYFDLSRATFRNLVIRDNEAGFGSDTQRGGGGIYNDHTQCRFINCVITGNRSGHRGGGVYNNGAIYPDGVGTSPQFIHCTITANHGQTVGGMFNTGSANPTVLNSILWGNTHAGMPNLGAQIIPLAGVIVRYSHVQDLSTAFIPDPTNSPLNPLFVDFDGVDGIPGTPDDDLRLSDLSPCINAGDPASVIGPGDLDAGNGPRRVGCRVDIGAYESPHDQDFGDFNDDGRIDLRDAAAFQLCFGTPGSGFSWSPTCLCLFDAQPDGAVGPPDNDPFLSLITGP